MTYNISFVGEASDLYAVTVGANNLLGGWLGTAILVVVYLVILASFSYRFDPKKVMLYASFVVMILGLVLWSVGLIPGSHLGIPGFLMFIGILAVML